MLLVSTYLDKSLIQGIGLFASSDITEGSTVWEESKLTTIKYTLEEWKNLKEELPTTAFNNLVRFAYYNERHWKLNMDDSRFMNHSVSANLTYADRKCVASMDIPKGEELTVPYASFCDINDYCGECGICD